MKDFFLFILVIALAIWGYIYYTSGPKILNNPPPNNTIVAFGDSLVLGTGSTPGNDFVSALSRKMQQPILNMGVSGETSAQGLERIDEVIEKKPGTVIVLFGGNDYLQKVHSTETFSNLKTIIEQLQNAGAMVVLLGVRGGLFVDNFEPEFKQLAEESKVLFIPDVLDGLFQHDEFMYDAVHPNDAGYEMIAEKVYEAIKKNQIKKY